MEKRIVSCHIQQMATSLSASAEVIKVDLNHTHTHTQGSVSVPAAATLLPATVSAFIGLSWMNKSIISEHSGVTQHDHKQSAQKRGSPDCESFATDCHHEGIPSGPHVSSRQKMGKEQQGASFCLGRITSRLVSTVLLLLPRAR